MKLDSKLAVSAAMLALALGTTPLLAQQSQQPAQPPSADQARPQTKTASGELKKVDVDKKVVQIETADKKEMEFRFTTATEVTGESRNVEGLATKTGTRVTVDYTGEGANMVATKIAIQAEAKPAPPAPAPAPAPRP